MPRRPARPAPPPSPPPLPVVPNNAEDLRTQWKWAAFSQFFFTFSQLFHLPDISIHDIERDLLNDTNIVLPKVMQRLLYTVSYDRKISLSNWQTALRKQYNKRDPTGNPIGPEPHRTPGSLHEADDDEDNANALHDAPPLAELDAEHSEDNRGDTLEPRSRQPSQQISTKTTSVPPDGDHALNEAESLDWLQLPMLVKLDSMHTLVEWQFQNPGRLRTLMKSDDEHATWRIEPIGYDSKSNAYWLIGTDRLWIQRAPPRKPKPLKRKRPAPKKVPDVNPSKLTPSSKRPRVESANGRQTTRSANVVEASPGRKSRAAKDQAKLKLDAQARALTQLQLEASTSNASSRTRGGTRSRPAAPPPRASLGTRVSARLRGQKEEDEEEWQPIPDDWLDEKKKPVKPPRTGLESDEESELTELSDETTPSEDEDTPTKQEAEVEKVPHVEEQPELDQPEGFVEWELICATLEEWEHITDRFANATHYTEKALFKVLKNDLVPVVVEELREARRKQQLDEALSHRKRSSRLAMRESEKEEARLEAKRKAEEMEKMSRARRLEARQQREEAERDKREKAREQRRLEREMREAKRHAPPSPSPEPEPPAIVETPSKPAQAKPRKRETKSSTKTSKASEDWELFCEICNQHAINPKDTSPVVSCGYCSKWQHIGCHDRADREAGRAPRDWKRADFICRQCHSVRTNGQGHAYSNSHSLNRSSSYQATPHTYNAAPSNYNSFQNGYTSKDAPYAYYQPPQGNGHFQQPAQRYPPPSHPAMQYLPNPQQPAPPRHNISFSHYQPAQRNFVPIQKGYAEMSPQQAYGQVSHYNQQPYGSAAGPYKPPMQQMWTPPPAPPQPSNYTLPPLAHPNLQQPSSSYRPYPSDTRDYPPAHGSVYGPAYSTHSPHYPQAPPITPSSQQQVRPQSSSYSSSMGGP